jgi:hypothetical protein
VLDPESTGAHWDFPERQVAEGTRERSIEHEFLTPVFGTSVPLRGASGRIRAYAYARFSEARAAHWLMLIAADRVDVVESRVRALATGHPDNPITETGIRAELTHGGWTSRRGAGRADVKHQWMDPVIVAGPTVVLAAVAGRLVRRAVRRRSGAATS